MSPRAVCERKGSDPKDDAPIRLVGSRRGGTWFSAYARTIAGEATRNAEAIAFFTRETTLAVVGCGRDLRAVPRSACRCRKRCPSKLDHPRSSISSPRRTRRIVRSRSRAFCRSRVSWIFCPRQSPNDSLIRRPREYTDRGTSVKPFC